MHTALHLGVRAAAEIRRAMPQAHLCFFGLYALLNAEHLLEGVCDSVIGGECEEPLVELADALANGRAPEGAAGVHVHSRLAEPYLARLSFVAPERQALPALEHYAGLQDGGSIRTAAAVEASRGCLHHCRHCPIPAVYEGRFFVVPREIVLEDIRRVVNAGARHVTFADPDFWNGPGHVMPIVRELHERWPNVTFDVTTKIENILEHRDLLAELSGCGCLFLVSAVESLSDEVLGHLLKGHTADDVFEALDLVRSAGIFLRPSLVAFTPWTGVDDYVEVIDWVDREHLVGQVDAVQYSIRLLVPPGSALVQLEAFRPHLGELAPDRFSYLWQHPDPAMDRLHEEVSAIVREATRSNEDVAQTFDRVRDAAYAAARRPAPTRTLPARESAPPPRLTEPWFC
jgi:hypothetical protein